MNGVLDKYDLPAVLQATRTDALAGQADLRGLPAQDATPAMETVIFGTRHSRPRTYGKRPGYNGETLLRNSPRYR
ncbi:hypothetical protein [Stenotrophomonas phage CM2]